MEMDQVRERNCLRSDKPGEECGVLGVSSLNEDAAQLAYLGLFAVQHRGQESAGIAVRQDSSIKVHKGMGLVGQVFDDQALSGLRSALSIGHTRYSTTGSSTLENAQPFQIHTRFGPLALAHNGNLVNAVALQDGLLERGVGMVTKSDSEIMMLMLAAAPGKTWIDRLAHAMQSWVGAFSLVILTSDGIYATRDPWGMRPLTIGLLPGGGHAVCSETGALDSIGCQSVREMHPGEIVAIRNSALIVRQAMPPAESLALCTFEHIYFSRPDSVWDGRLVYNVRRRLGVQLAREAAVPADMVIPVPDSSVPAALGFSEESGIPLEMALVKNDYIGRTFIQPSQELRERRVLMKFNPLRRVIQDKRVILLDDSIVRSTTARRLVAMLREVGAREVHLRIISPPITHPCFMGVDMPTAAELIAAEHPVEEIQRMLDADSLRYISLPAMMRAVGSETGYCNACFTGIYPFPINSEHCLE